MAFLSQQTIVDPGKVNAATVSIAGELTTQTPAVLDVLQQILVMQKVIANQLVELTGIGDLYDTDDICEL